MCLRRVSRDGVTRFLSPLHRPRTVNSGTSRLATHELEFGKTQYFRSTLIHSTLAYLCAHHYLCMYLSTLPPTRVLPHEPTLLVRSISRRDGSLTPPTPTHSPAQFSVTPPPHLTHASNVATKFSPAPHSPSLHQLTEEKKSRRPNYSAAGHAGAGKEAA